MDTLNKASCALLEGLRHEAEHADVHLVFKGGVVLTAHASVLTLTSDYYKEALSAKWTHGREGNAAESIAAVTDEGDPTTAHISKKRQTSTRSTARKIILRHPNVDAEIGKVALDFLYLGDAEIPPSLILSVIAFADEILVSNLVQKCVNNLVEENKLSAKDALDYYVQFDRVRAHVNGKAYALNKMLLNLPLALESGREVLAQMNEAQVKTLLLFKPFTPLHRWRILIAWCRVCQDAEGDLSLESNLSEDFQTEEASKLIKPLLPVVELFKIPDAHFNRLEPFQVLLPKSVRDMYEFHSKQTTESGENQWTATHQNLMEIMRAIQQYLPVDLQSQNVATDPILLFHGKPSKSIRSDFHKACDGTANTLILIKVKNGNIFGGFVDAKWSNENMYCDYETVFTFLIGPDGPFRVLGTTDGEGTDSRINRPRFGMNFFWFMEEFAMAAEKHKDVFSGFDEGERLAIIRQLKSGGINCSAIEDYKVYHIN
ncbi:hypothetical protein HDU77_003785 [Chytriomyces hyalinus]|nr:hypothetical protein HDU77_003785 [Chytriomyces hyalinus]